jgi:hypothetical protein
MGSSAKEGEWDGELTELTKMRSLGLTRTSRPSSSLMTSTADDSRQVLNVPASRTPSMA